MPWPRPSLPDLIRRTAEDFRSRLPGDAFLRHSFEWALSRVIAGLTHGLYGHQEWISRQAVPGPDADDETILQWAALFLDPPRILATRAKGQVTFTGNDGVTVPPGTELSIGDVLYRVDTGGTVVGGQVELDATAVRAGASGNAVEGARVTLTSPIAGLDSTGEVGHGDITGGTDDEPISGVRRRLANRLANPPRGGGPGDFIAWVLEARGEGVPVDRAWEYPLREGLGTVGIAFTVEGPDPVNLPTPEQRETVHDYVRSKAPVHMRELVSLELQPVPFAVHVKINPDNLVVRNAVRAQIRDLLLRFAEPEMTIPHLEIVRAISATEGLLNSAIVAPTGDVNPGTSGIFIYDDDAITIEAL